PWTDAASVAAESSRLVLLLSATYEQEMRAALPGVAPQRIFSLAEVMAAAATEAEFQAVRRGIASRAAELVCALKASIRPGGQSVCFVSHNPGDWSLDIMLELRARGWSVALVCLGAPDSAPDSTLYGPQGEQLAVRHAEPTEAALQSVLLAALGQYQPFRLVHSWAMLQNHAFMKALTDLGIPLAASFEDFFPLLAEDQGYAEAFSASQGLRAQELIELWREVFGRCRGIIIKDSPVAVRLLEERHGFANANILYALPPVGQRAAQGHSHEPGRPVRVCLAQSVHSTIISSWTGSAPYFLEQIKAYTALGLDFTLFNNYDNGSGRSFNCFREAEERNPLFHYRQRLPYEALCEELPAYDFGALWHHPALVRRHPSAYRINLQLKVLTYLYAGLPTLAPVALEWCSDVVERLGIGLSFADDEGRGLAQRLERFDRPACELRMAQARQTLNIRDYAAKLDGFFLSLGPAGSSAAKQGERA
ncbi:MAG TPA: hypothetical protein VN419_11040, partial [Humidesulfovibrio sp.]|uniref:hypothetical protein n=1 Tax=Humidesulfovibrio sp. TaxID=2910988 RepID=UPI002B8B2B2A